MLGSRVQALLGVEPHLRALTNRDEPILAGINRRLVSSSVFCGGWRRLGGLGGHDEVLEEAVGRPAGPVRHCRASTACTIVPPRLPAVWAERVHQHHQISHT